MIFTIVGNGPVFDHKKLVVPLNVNGNKVNDMDNSKLALLTPVIVNSPFYDGPAIVTGHAENGYYVKTEACEGYVSTLEPSGKAVRPDEETIIDLILIKYSESQA